MNSKATPKLFFVTRGSNDIAFYTLVKLLASEDDRTFQCLIVNVLYRVVEKRRKNSDIQVFSIVVFAFTFLQFPDVGILLNVKVDIEENSLVKLHLSQEISDVPDNVYNEY